MRLYLPVIAIIGAALFFTCSDKPTEAGSGSSESGNAMITGKLYLSDGITPAVNATLHIRKKSVLADTSSSSLGRVLADTSATVITNDTGGFAIDSLNPGLYVIEGAKDSDLVLIDSVTVTSQDSTVTLPPDTLKPAGALKGVISLSEGGDPRKVFILAFGIDRFAGVNVDGSFKFSSLAEARYDLRIISSLDNYGVLDTFGISINSADTTNMDTIRLPFTGIPTPKNLNLTYDTLGQVVALAWNKADTGLVKGYNIYRRNIDSNFVLINRSIVTDTAYLDNSLAEDGTYEYLVAALDKQNNEGNRSLTITVVFKNRLQLATNNPAFGRRWEHSSVAFNGKMWVIGGTNGSLQNDVWYSIDGTAWIQATGSANFSARRGLASLVFENKMWVIGGFTANGRMNDAWYSSDGITWTQATASAAFPKRAWHSCLTYANKMWVVGGNGDNAPQNDVWYSTDGIAWSLAVNSAEFPARGGSTLAAANEKMWVIGGSDANGVLLNDVWYSDSGITWIQATSSAEFSGRTAPSAVLDSSIWIVCGYRAPIGALDDIWYSNSGIHWSQLNTPPDFGPRANHTSIVLNNTIWIIGLESTNLKTEVWYLR